MKLKLKSNMTTKRKIIYFLVAMFLLDIMFFLLDKINGGAFFELSFGIRLVVYALLAVLSVAILFIVDDKVYKHDQEKNKNAAE